MKFYSLISVCLFILLASIASPAQGNPVPFINQPLVPTSAEPNGAGFTLTVNGTGFVRGAVVNWNASALMTTFVSGSQLTATVPASDIATAGTAGVTVSNPKPGGGISNVVFFQIHGPGTNLTFTSLGANLGFSGTQNVLAGDFNGDGKLDLATTNFNVGNANSVCILLGRGDGSFDTPICYTGTEWWSAPVAADFNGDGKLDLAVPDSFGNTVAIFLGNGDGTLQAPHTFATSLNPVTVVAADFNGDGKLDLAVANGGNASGAPGSVSILLGNGDGTFQKRVDYSANTLVNGLTIGDFNGDGKLDLATVDLGLDGTSSSFCIQLGHGDGSFESPACPSTGTQNWQSPIAADFNGDGRLDLAMAASDNAYNSVAIFLGNGDGTFQTGVSYSTGVEPVNLAAADFNADGKLDLAVANASSRTLSVLLGNGDGTFQNPVDLATSQNSIGVPGPLVAADFDQNGEPDLALALTDGVTYSLEAFLQGPFAVATFYPQSLTFAEPVIGRTTPAQSIILENTGVVTLSFSGIAISGADAGDFAQTNSCGANLGVNAYCQISVTFTPKARGTREASLIITDNAPGNPQSISLTGNTLVPVVSLSPPSVVFPNQYVGKSVTPVAVTLSNTGTAALTITNVETSEADFGDMNGCGSTLAFGAHCSISIVFSPTAAGYAAGTLTIADNAGNSPQTVSLSGTGQDFSVAPASSTSATVTPGQNASYTIAVAPGGGFNQTVTLSCSGAPAQSTCSVSPSSITLNGSSASPARVTVTTMGSSAGVTQPTDRYPDPGVFAMWVAFSGALGLAMLASLNWHGGRHRQLIYRLALLCLLATGITLPACGGGGNGSHGTQPGTYTLTVTGTFTSGSTKLTHSMNLTLVVQIGWSGI